MRFLTGILYAMTMGAVHGAAAERPASSPLRESARMQVQQSVKGSALRIPAEPLTDWPSIFLARSARLGRVASRPDEPVLIWRSAPADRPAVQQREQYSRWKPHNGLVKATRVAEARRAQEGTSGGHDDPGAFFKSKRGATLLVLAAAGIGYMWYSKFHDRIHSRERERSNQ